MDCSTLGFLVDIQIPELAQTHAHQVDNAIQPSHSSVVRFFSCIQSSQHQGFSNESILHIRWPRYWSFSFSIKPCNEFSRLISFRIDWFDLHAVQGTLKSLLQHHSSKVSILWCSAFLMVQLSQLKKLWLWLWTFFSKVRSLLFNTLSRFVIAFLPRSYGMITHLEPYVLECKVKCTLGSIITTNKASASYGIPDELFQILKDDAVKVLNSICKQNCKTQKWPQDWKSQFSFHTQRKAMPKNVQITSQLHSSHTLAK